MLPSQVKMMIDGGLTSTIDNHGRCFGVVGSHFYL